MKAFCDLVTIAMNPIQVDKALREREGQMRLFIDNAPASLAMFDRDMRYLAASRRWMTDFGLGDQDVMGRCHYDVFPDVPERWMHVHRIALQGEVVKATDDRFVRLDGQEQWLQWEVRPWFTADDDIGGIVIFCEDITVRKRVEVDLRDREERLAAILNAAVDAIITVDHQGVIRSVNPATARLFGYAEGGLVDRRHLSALVPSLLAEYGEQDMASVVRAGTMAGVDKRREVVACREDGTMFPADLAVNEIPHLQLFCLMIRDISKRRDLERDVVEAASGEQRRIGQDLHDSVGQELTALNMLVTDLVDGLQGQPEQRMLAVKLADGLRRCKSELRTVMRGLLPVSVDAFGLMSALSDLAEHTENSGKVCCVFDCSPVVPVADNLVATHLYLIAQEAVHNALKHARPRNIRIQLEVDQQLVLRVQDDGEGIFDPAREVRPEEGLGLRIMRNRAAVLGATLTIESAPDKGTLVVCTLPMQ